MNPVHNEGEWAPAHPQNSQQATASNTAQCGHQTSDSRTYVPPHRQEGPRTVPFAQATFRPSEFSVFVGSLGPEVKNEDLGAPFKARYPSYTKAQIMYHRETGFSRGFGFVRFSNKLERDDALRHMNNTYVMGAPITVSPPTKEKHSDHQTPAASGVSQAEGIATRSSLNAAAEPFVSGAGGIGFGGTASPLGPHFTSPPITSFPQTFHQMPPVQSITTFQQAQSASMQQSTSPSLQQAQMQPQSQPQTMHSQLQQPPGHDDENNSKNLSRPTFPNPGFWPANDPSSPMENPHLYRPGPALGPELDVIDPPVPALAVPVEHAANTTVFVGGLTNGTTEEELKYIFGEFGRIEHIAIPENKGCGFIRYSKHEQAALAIYYMQGVPIGNARVRLSWGKHSTANRPHRSA